MSVCVCALISFRFRIFSACISRNWKNRLSVDFCSNKSFGFFHWGDSPSKKNADQVFSYHQMEQHEEDGVCTSFVHLFCELATFTTIAVFVFYAHSYCAFACFIHAVVFHLAAIHTVHNVCTRKMFVPVLIDRSLPNNPAFNPSCSTILSSLIHKSICLFETVW